MKKFLIKNKIVKNAKQADALLIVVIIICFVFIFSSIFKAKYSSNIEEVYYDENGDSLVDDLKIGLMEENI